MANINPIRVSNKEEINIAASEGRTAIVVTDKEMYKKLKKEIRSDKQTDKAGKIIAVAGGFTLFFTGYPIILGIALLALGIIGFNSPELKDYKITVIEEREELLLIKVKGDNSIQKGDIVVGYEELKFRK